MQEGGFPMTTPETDKHLDSTAARGLFRSLATALQDMRERYRLMRNLDELSAEDRQRILADCRLSQADIDAFRAHGPEELLPEMMARFGVDAEALQREEGAVLHDIRRVCAACPSQRQCRKALAAGASLDECRKLCPNAGTFDSLTAATSD